MAWSRVKALHEHVVSEPTLGFAAIARYSGEYRPVLFKDFVMAPATVTRNRAAFPVDELEKYAGKWVAFDADCTKILAAHENVEELVKLVEQAGLDPQQVRFEGVPEGIIHGGLG